MLFKKLSVFIVFLWSFQLNLCYSQIKKAIITSSMQPTTSIIHTYDTAVFAAGCFWCTEAIFLQVKGVIKVESGYMGGHIDAPTYEQVCTGRTGHAEVCRIVFDSKLVSYQQLLKAFFIAHDPTQLNRQGNDEGTQYRSSIFYKNEQQKKLASYYIKQLNEAHVYPKNIVTILEPIDTFYKAEEYHNNYYAQHKEQAYCRFVIQPKLEKFDKVFNKL
jgi:peptide-methionine (S)-S-oxide reductase